MKHINFWCRFTICLLVLSLLTAGPVVAMVTPLEQVRSTVQGILGVMQNNELRKPDKKAQRRAEIMAYVDKRFDFEEMAKLALARRWRERTPAEKKQFAELFADLLKNTYTGRIEAYSNEKVRYDKELFDSDRRTRALVYTTVIKNNQEIPINYMLLNKDGDWYVYDVLIEGVSLIRNYRTEFERIIEREKYEGLIKRIKEKIAKQENGGK